MLYFAFGLVAVMVAASVSGRPQKTTTSSTTPHHASHSIERGDHGSNAMTGQTQASVVHPTLHQPMANARPAPDRQGLSTISNVRNQQHDTSSWNYGMFDDGGSMF